MKNLLIDFCLVLLILVVGTQIMDSYTTEQLEIKKQMEVFNQDIEEKEVVSSPYIFTKDPIENKVSHMVEEISDFSREGIKIFVNFFSKSLSGF